MIVGTPVYLAAIDDHDAHVPLGVFPTLESAKTAIEAFVSLQKGWRKRPWGWRTYEGCNIQWYVNERNTPYYEDYHNTMIVREIPYGTVSE